MRVAMLSVHACPKAKLGGRDSGGMNVYIRELARDLARRGIEVDVYTRQRENEHPRIQEIAPAAGVNDLGACSAEYRAKKEVYARLDEFTAGRDAYVRAEALQYDVIHA